MLSRPLLSFTYRQRFWEFFIFGWVFVALFIFWMIIEAGAIISYITGGGAGLCFTAAWFYWYLRSQTTIEHSKTEHITPTNSIIVPATSSIVISQQFSPIDLEQNATMLEAIQTEKLAETERNAAIERLTNIEEHVIKEDEHVGTKQSFEEPGSISTTSLKGLEKVSLIKAVRENIPDQEQSESHAFSDHLEASAHALPVVLLHKVDPMQIPIMEAYCVRCRHKQPMHNSQRVELKSGHPALRATCPVCNTGMFRIISLQQEKDWLA